MKRKNISKTNKGATVFIIISFALGIIGGFYVYEIYSIFTKEKDSLEVKVNNFDSYKGQEYTAIIKVPAVDKDEKGVATDLLVKVTPGTGKTLVDINGLLFWVDTQNSIRMAKLVAEEYTKIDADSYDITYSVNADAALIGGESAGTALTIATIAALQNKQINDAVMITGTINHDGSIGPVGAILEKAKAAKENGAEIFLVPLLQKGEINYEEKEHCEKFGLTEWCTTERIPVKVDIAQEAGLEVKEVGNIAEAVEYFIS